MSRAYLATWFTAVERPNVDGKVPADWHFRGFEFFCWSMYFNAMGKEETTHADGDARRGRDWGKIAHSMGSGPRQDSRRLST
ncbi:hypothetical protein CHR55_22345 [Rhodococcus qingshengii]|uniref:Uncharacterized protein n=1 Tax=Rhodococcus qingshengii TaxID=334542 RepID=A0A2A5J638_RHOSG|nr:hypothetical protein BH686_21810 [Rhodococcus erythropolis]PCK25035.1 hypothetical protein CHR55_22345 [Rhodococcus qingshengii]